MIWPFKNKQKNIRKVVDPRVCKRSYVGAESGRLYNWQSASDRSADRKIKNALQKRVTVTNGVARLPSPKEIKGIIGDNITADWPEYAFPIKVNGIVVILEP